MAECKRPCAELKLLAAKEITRVKRPVEVAEVRKLPREGVVAVKLERPYDVTYEDRRGDIQRECCVTENWRSLPRVETECYSRMVENMATTRAKQKGRPTSSLDKVVAALTCIPDGLTKHQISAVTDVPIRSVERIVSDLEPLRVPPELRKYAIEAGDYVLGERLYRLSPSGREAVKKFVGAEADYQKRVFGKTE